MQMGNEENTYSFLNEPKKADSKALTYFLDRKAKQNSFFYIFKIPYKYFKSRN